MIIGLTGLYCAGKNRIAGLLEKRGLAILDVDKSGWQALEDAKNEIAERWGRAVLRPSDLENSGIANSISVDRKALAGIVFKKGAEGELKALEDIVHPRVDGIIENWLSQNQNKDCVLNAALLHKTRLFPSLDRVILVHAPLIVRIFRAKKRDRLSFFDILRRFSSQKTFNSQYLTKNSDTIIIENCGKGLEAKVEELMRFIKR